MVKLLFRPRARAELIEAATWHERKRAALGAEFIAEVQKVVDALQANPNDIHRSTVTCAKPWWRVFRIVSTTDSPLIAS